MTAKEHTIHCKRKRKEQKRITGYDENGTFFKNPEEKFNCGKKDEQSFFHERKGEILVLK